MLPFLSVSSSLVPSPLSPLLALRALADEARTFAAAAKADSTRRAYASNWRHFTAWCQAHALTSLPAAPETVALYLTALAKELKVASIQRAFAALGQAHRFAGHEPPTKAALVTETMRGIRRTLGTRPTTKTAAVASDLCRLLETCDDTPAGIRDRSLLTMGFAGAFRRSELAALDLRDVTLTREGMVILVRRAKTDQEGMGVTIPIPHEPEPTVCPVLAYEAWIELLSERGDTAPEQPLFRSIDRHGHIAPDRLTDKSVARVVKRAAQRAGFDPAVYAGHSLRAGFATSAAQAGRGERQIMTQTRHKSVVVARKYIREGNLFRDHAGAGLLSEARRR